MKDTNSENSNPIPFIEKHLTLLLATISLVITVAAGYRDITTKLTLLEFRLQLIEKTIDRRFYDERPTTPSTPRSYRSSELIGGQGAIESQATFEEGSNVSNSSIDGR